MKQAHDYRTLKIRIKSPDPRLFELQKQAAEVYNYTLKLYWEAIAAKQIPLTTFGALQRTKHIENNLHSHSAQLATKGFYSAIKTAKALARKNPRARRPNKPVIFRSVEWDETAIRVKGNTLVLSLAKGNAPIVLPWHTQDAPKIAKITFDKTQRCYYLCATFDMGPFREPVGEPKPCEVAAIDQGEIHLVTYATKDRAVIINGRAARSRRRYRNKAQAALSRRISASERGSRRHKRLMAAKRSMLRKCANQINNDVHQATRKAVSLAKEDRVHTLVIGDIRGIRKNNNKGKKINQKVHQAPFHKVREQLTYKAKAEGMRVVLQNEAFTSQTCPHCDSRNKPKGRSYICSCGFTLHRDALGAANIRKRYLKKVLFIAEPTSVDGVLIPPTVGIRINSRRVARSDTLVPALVPIDFSVA